MNKPEARVEVAATLQPLWLMCRARVVDAQGNGVAGEPVRFSGRSAPVTEDRLRVGQFGGEENGGVRILPLNVGLPDGHGVSGADGYVHAVVPIDPRGYHDGVVVRTARLGIEHGRRVEPSLIERDAFAVRMLLEAARPATRAVRGRLLDRNGDPCKHARVFAVDRAQVAGIPVPTACDERGEFAGSIPEGSDPIWLVVDRAQTYQVDVGGIPTVDRITVQLGALGSGRASILR